LRGHEQDRILTIVVTVHRKRPCLTQQLLRDWTRTNPWCRRPFLIRGLSSSVPVSSTITRGLCVIDERLGVLLGPTFGKISEMGTLFFPSKARRLAASLSFTLSFSPRFLLFFAFFSSFAFLSSIAFFSNPPSSSAPSLFQDPPCPNARTKSYLMTPGNCSTRSMQGTKTIRLTALSPPQDAALD
jgi:hypothetical protein